VDARLETKQELKEGSGVLLRKSGEPFEDTPLIRSGALSPVAAALRRREETTNTTVLSIGSEADEPLALESGGQLLGVLMGGTEGGGGR